MNNLLWKQWNENKFHFILFMIWMLLAVFYCISYELGYQLRASVGHFSGLTLFYSITAAIFLAMSTAKGEQTNQTLSFSASLPVSMRKLATYRISGAVATLAIPIIFATVLMSIALLTGLIEQAEPRIPKDYLQGIQKRLPERPTAPLLTSLNQLWSVAAISILGGTELLLLICLLGGRLKNQSQIGFLGVIMAFGSMITMGILWDSFSKDQNKTLQIIYSALFPQSLMIPAGYGTKHAYYTDLIIFSYSWISIGLSVPILLIIGRIFVTQYGKLRGKKSGDQLSRFRFTTPSIFSYIPFRWPTQMLAIIWLELRQSLPLAIFGFIFAAVMTLASVIPGNYSNGSLGTSFLMHLSGSTWVVGTLWATVVGSTIFSTDLNSNLGSFRRSRPISTNMWFWCKYLIGLIAVVSILDGVTILISWDAPKEAMTTGMSWSYVVCMPILHAFMYSLAVLGICWIRKPVISGFLTIFAFALITIILGTFQATKPYDPMNVYNAVLLAERADIVPSSLNNQPVIDFTQHGYPVVYGSMLLFSFLFALLASRLAKPLEPSPPWFLSMKATH